MPANYKTQDVPGDGNCFYYVLAHQMMLSGDAALTDIFSNESPHDVLRLRAQGHRFRDRDWAGDSEIRALVKEFKIVIAVFNVGQSNCFQYYYPDSASDSEVLETVNREDIPGSLVVLRLAYTGGNHFQSIVDAGFDPSSNPQAQQYIDAIWASFQAELESQQEMPPELESQQEMPHISALLQLSLFAASASALPVQSPCPDSHVAPGC